MNKLKMVGEELKRTLDNRGFSHLSVIVRGEHITVCIKEEDYKENICRLTYISDNKFGLSMANHKGRWQATPFTGTVDELIENIINQFGWVFVKR